MIFFFTYSRINELIEVKLTIAGSNGQGITFQPESIICRFTDEPYDYPAGRKCSVHLPFSFIDDVLGNVLWYGGQYGVPASVPNRKFTATLSFRSHPPVRRTFEVLPSIESAASPVIFHDWSQAEIQNDIIVRGALRGSVDGNGCFAICGQTNVCPSRTVSASEAFALSHTGTTTISIGGYLGLGYEIQTSDESGAEILIHFPAVEITAGQGELCLPLYNIRADVVNVPTYNYGSNSCNPSASGPK